MCLTDDALRTIWSPLVEHQLGCRGVMHPHPLLWQIVLSAEDLELTMSKGLFWTVTTSGHLVSCWYFQCHDIELLASPTLHVSPMLTSFVCSWAQGHGLGRNLSLSIPNLQVTAEGFLPLRWFLFIYNIMLFTSPSFLPPIILLSTIFLKAELSFDIYQTKRRRLA